MTKETNKMKHKLRYSPQFYFDVIDDEHCQIFGYPTHKEQLKLVQKLRHQYTNYDQLVFELDPHEDHTSDRVELKCAIFKKIAQIHPFLKKAADDLIQREQRRLQHHLYGYSYDEMV